MIDLKVSIRLDSPKHKVWSLTLGLNYLLKGKGNYVVCSQWSSHVDSRG